MDGAFNDLALSVSPGADVAGVIDRLDVLLKPYGGLGAASRANQISHRYLSEEFKGLRQMATVFPAIFLGVAAFLLNVVVTRLVSTQREQVAILKAFGYTNLRLVLHYIEMAVVIVVIGSVLGTLGGAWFGRGLSAMYMDFYKFPFLVFHLTPRAVLLGVLISVAAAILGCVASVARAAALPPAEAMQPPRPARYRVSIVERLGLRRLLAQPTRMILRNIERRPVKALLTVVGASFACAILVMGLFFNDAVVYMVDVQFKLAQREDITVSFVEPTSRRALYSLAALPAVEHVEPYRVVPANLRFQHRSYRTAVSGIPEAAALRRLLDTNLQPVPLPPDGVAITDHLAKILAIRPGDRLTIEVLEGSRPTLEAPVTGLVNEYVGVAAYMRLDALNRALREGNAVSGAYLLTDSTDIDRFYRRLNQTPRVAGSAGRLNALQSFYDTMARQMLTFAFFNTIFAMVIAIGVVYNSTRIAFAERSRELASLRVLGFTRGEIAYILLGELGLLTIAALPVGLVLGRALSAFMVHSFQTDLYRIPIVIAPSTYSFAATVVLVSAAISAWLIKRRLDRLDLVAVLKTKE
jgi:putative ABC transport system permease protein